MPALEVPSKKALVFPLEIVYEDDDLAVINKPPGILVSGNSFKTIANALSQNLKKSTRLDAVRPLPVHRLDYPTTGLLLVGKTSSSILTLNQLFEHKTILKTYIAVCIGNMPLEGVIDLPIDYKTATSRFKVLKTISSKRFQYLNLVVLFPETGRKHQLRKHLSIQGNPILGDRHYGKEPMILKGKGLYLHAFSLSFSHPSTTEKIEFTKEPPLKFHKLFPNSFPLSF